MLKTFKIGGGLVVVTINDKLLCVVKPTGGEPEFYNMKLEKI